MEKCLTAEQINILKESVASMALAMSDVGISKFVMDLKTRTVDMEVADDLPVDQDRFDRFNDYATKMAGGL